ncbi:hypothetical protein [Lysobacter panacisoli]|uniref:Uncharacterized protein n=1 Tax=Lysobacter panacisoli TaxID=1255263 RepID=A0ABP9LRK0_9GAMM|nr:hypothetical protein [Lysobacter panacisoli]
MGIDVHWKDERGAILGAVDDEGALSDISDLLHCQSDSVCLRFIDPAGDACFNQQQLPILLAELRQLLPNVSAEASAHLHAIVRLLEGATRTHTYIWFLGD